MRLRGFMLGLRLLLEGEKEKMEGFKPVRTFFICIFDVITNNGLEFLKRCFSRQPLKRNPLAE